MTHTSPVPIPEFGNATEFKINCEPQGYVFICEGIPMFAMVDRMDEWGPRKIPDEFCMLIYTSDNIGESHLRYFEWLELIFPSSYCDDDGFHFAVQDLAMMKLMCE